MPEVPIDELLRRLQAGEPMLDCRLACLDAWRANRATALVLIETRRWRELAVLVMQTGYTDDLTYFYLGRAAEGLGYQRGGEDLLPDQRTPIRGRAGLHQGEPRLVQRSAPPGCG
jgi:hypothetical protein